MGRPPEAARGRKVLSAEAAGAGGARAGTGRRSALAGGEAGVAASRSRTGWHSSLGGDCEKFQRERRRHTEREVQQERERERERGTEEGARSTADPPGARRDLKRPRAQPSRQKETFWAQAQTAVLTPAQPRKVHNSRRWVELVPRGPPWCLSGVGTLSPATLESPSGTTWRSRSRAACVDRAG